MALVVQHTHRTKVVLTAYLVLIWLAVAVSGSLLGTFVQQPGTPPLTLGVAAGGPVILFIVVYLFSAAFRRFVRSLIGDPWGITALQAYRVIGIVFVVLALRNTLPAVFALPAGLGDVFIGGTAPLVALVWSSGSRFGNVVFVLWNVLGMLDLITALSLGTLAGTVLPGPITMAPIGLFPLSLIPTFLVPLSFLLHFAGLGQFRHLSRK